jgi:spermidine dehydrogenase
LKDLGVDLDRLKKAFDVDFFKRHNLRGVTYFNKRKFGVDKVVKHPFCYYQRFVQGLLRPKLSYEEAVKQTPLSEKGKEQLLRVLKGGVHVLKVPQEKLEEYISTHSYFDYLKNTLGVDDPGVLEMARNSCIDNLGEGADVTTIGDALTTGGLGFDPASLKDVMGQKRYEKYIKEHGYIMVDEDPYVHHFPDGNASLTRLLVRKMIPNVGPGDSAEDIVLSKFNYSELDKSSNIVRIRLNSTVVNVKHGGDPNSSSDVFVGYINGKKSRSDGLLQRDDPSYSSRYSRRTSSGIKTEYEDTIVLQHSGIEELEGNERDGNWSGHIARKYAPGGADGLSG